MKNNTKNIDLSTKSDSITSYLIKHIDTIDKKTYEEIVVIFKDAKNHISVSDAYIASVLVRLEERKHNRRALMKYFGDIVLKGSNLGVVNTSLAW